MSEIVTVSDDPDKVVVTQDGEITVVTVVSEGPQGPPGDVSGADRFYAHPFAPASSVSVTHNMGKYPSVTVVDTAGDECVGDVHYVSEDELTVSFSNSFGGVLYLN